jgi:hypothetical protein
MAKQENKGNQNEEQTTRSANPGWRFRRAASDGVCFGSSAGCADILISAPIRSSSFNVLSDRKIKEYELT